MTISADYAHVLEGWIQSVATWPGTVHYVEFAAVVLLAITFNIAIIARFRRAASHSAKRIDEIKADRDQKVAQLADALERLDAPYIRQAAERKQALAEMKKVWLNPNALERTCQALLNENRWVLLPDYEIVEDKFFMERAISTLVSQLFPKSAMTEDEAARIDATYTRARADLGGWVWAKGSLQPNFAQRNESVLLLIELKRPSATIGRDAIRQAHGYAWEIVRRAEDKLWAQPVECLVIGGAVEDGLSDVNVRLGSSPHQAIRITPLSYDRLITRAERLVDALSGPSHAGEHSASTPTALAAE